MDVLVYRDPRESPRKCSLTPLRRHPEIRFVHHRPGVPIDAGSRVLLHPEGSVISDEDRGRALLVVDCSWRRLDSLLACVRGDLVRRRLPPLATAYPRKSSIARDPEEGLASVEALYAALFLLGEPRRELLEGYPWAETFLDANPRFKIEPAAR